MSGQTTATAISAPRPFLRLYDTMARTVKPLVPLEGETFRYYCCGPTVYGPAHIGNFRSFVLQDIFRRTLESTGLRTLHVRNITDVDDKTIRQSQAENRTLSEFCAAWTEQFHKDCTALHIFPPHVEPSAVGHIPDQIALIETLIKKGNAYRSPDGSVYYSIKSFPAYGSLSRLNERSITTDEKKPATAGETASQLAGNTAWNDEYDRESAADFALWKARRPEDGPNFWPSPWGDGRPGWHIECSAMSMKYLGESFDLHGGGVDLIFPHHENEIAQSEAATGQRFAAHWFHVAHLLVEGKKMSKSLGNLYTLSDIQGKGFTPEDLRFVLLSGSYRQPLNFTWDSLSAAHKALARLRDFRKRLGTCTRPERDARSPGAFGSVWEAMLDDLNTPEALGQLFLTVKRLSARIESEQLPPETLLAWRCEFEGILRLFGFELKEVIASQTEIPAEITDLANRRWQAKQAKDWALADSLRKELADSGWLVKDTASAYEILPAPPKN